MSIRYLLDTNIAIFALRARTPQVGQLFQLHAGHLALSTITVHELRYGVERSQDPARNLHQTEELINRLEVLSFDTAAAEHAALIRADLESLGTPIGGYDLLIAGHARSLGAVLVTHNTREFDRVRGLLVEDWAS